MAKETIEEQLEAAKIENTGLKKQITELESTITELQKEVETKEAALKTMKSAVEQSGSRPVIEFGGKSIQFTAGSFFINVNDEVVKVTAEEIESGIESTDKKVKEKAAGFLKTIIDKKVNVIRFI